MMNFRIQSKWVLCCEKVHHSDAFYNLSFIQVMTQRRVVECREADTLIHLQPLTVPTANILCLNQKPRGDKAQHAHSSLILKIQRRKWITAHNHAVRHQSVTWTMQERYVAPLTCVRILRCLLCDLLPSTSWCDREEPLFNSDFPQN